MTILKKLSLLSVIAAFGIIGTPANAKSIWQEVNESSPRSIAGHFGGVVQRTIFDDIQETAPVGKPQSDQDRLVGE